MVAVFVVYEDAAMESPLILPGERTLLRREVRHRLVAVETDQLLDVVYDG